MHKYKREEIDGKGTTHASYRHYRLWRTRPSHSHGSACACLWSRSGSYQSAGCKCRDVGCKSAARECQVGRTTVSARFWIAWVERQSQEVWRLCAMLDSLSRL